MTACERIILASGMPINSSAYKAVEVIGMPEARIILSQAVIYLALAPKSNSCYMAISNALSDIDNEKVEEVPNHLKDAHYKSAEKLKRGQDYKYPHDYNGPINQDYRKSKKKYFIANEAVDKPFSDRDQKKKTL